MQLSDKKFIKDAGVVGLLTVASRILGFIRDAVVAAFLGAGIYSDAFYAAFRIPDLFRKFFSDGALSISFISVFTKVHTERGKEAAFDMARSALVLVTTAGSIFLVVLMASTYLFFSDASLTIRLSIIMMPYILSICLISIFMGMLNSLGHFAAPAAAPLLLNLTIISAAVLAATSSGSPVYVVAWGVTAGGVVQLAIQVPFILRKGFRFGRDITLFHPDAIKAFRIMLPSVAGMAPFQLNMLVATFIASSLPTYFSIGSVSYLYYADRLVQFPLGLFTFSVATSIFPVLSKEVACNNLHEASLIFSKGLRTVLFLIIPSMAGLAVLREPIVALLFRHGAFGTADVHATAQILLCFCIGMWAFSGARLLVALFYALSDLQTPLKGGLISIISNFFLSFLLMKNFGVHALAISASIGSILNFLYLLKSISRYKLGVQWGEISATACRSLFMSAIMYFMVDLIARKLLLDAESGQVQLATGVLLSIISGAVIYLLAGFLIKSPELIFLKKK